MAKKKAATTPLVTSPDNITIAMEGGAIVYPEKSEEKSAQQDVMARFGDGLPYERERIVHEARFYAGRRRRPR